MSLRSPRTPQTSLTPSYVSAGTPIVQTVNGRRTFVVVLDCEGFTGGSNKDHDTRIFAMATLMCSMLVYNQKKTIDEPAIEAIGCIAKISEHLKASTNSGTVELAPFFPSLMWVVRDAQLRMVDKDGRRISADKFLRDTLEPSAYCGVCSVLCTLLVRDAGRTVFSPWCTVDKRRGDVKTRKHIKMLFKEVRGWCQCEPPNRTTQAEQEFHSCAVVVVRVAESLLLHDCEPTRQRICSGR